MTDNNTNTNTNINNINTNNINTNINKPKIGTNRKGALIVKWSNLNDYKAIGSMCSALRIISSNSAVVLNNKDKFQEEFNDRFYKI